MNLYEVVKSDNTTLHINLECIRSVKALDEGMMEVHFCDGASEVVSLSSLMGAFTHSETKVMSIQGAEAE